MASLIEGYNYDIFISYRQKDNKYDSWVTEFVDNLKRELEATFKDEISVYFDNNPQDGLLETHNVDSSLKEKLKCLIFIPIISQTYCDPKSFAWQHEFVAFNKMAMEDTYGKDIILANGNVASRILPVKIHELDASDQKVFEDESGGVLRAIEFIYREPGVNRPLSPDDDTKENLNKTKYRNQINKVANAAKDIIAAIIKYDKQDEGIIDNVIKSRPVVSKFLNQRTIINIFIAVAVILLGLFFVPGLLKSSNQIEKSIAVLPFRNDSPEDSTQYFMDGVMEELLTKLQSVKSLRIIGRTSVEQFRGQDKSISEIAKELGVNYIVEGSGQKSGNSLRMRVQLLVARNERHLWGNSFEQENLDMGEYFMAQSSFAEAIANELNAAMSADEKKLIGKTKTVDRDAYDDYLRSNELLGDLSRESFYKSLEYLNNAIEKDPDWAPLYSALGNVWIWIQQFGYEPTSVTFPEIYKNLDKALELDPNLSEAHSSRALIAYLMEWDWEKSEKEYLKALAVNPNDAGSRALYGQLLCTLQRTDEGIAQGRLAHELDPLNPNIKVWYGAILLCAGDCKTALALGEEITASDPGHLMANSLIGAAAFQCKEYDKMIKAVRSLLTEDNVKEEEINEIERIYRKQGIVKAYEKIMNHMEEYSENNYISPIDMASTYIMANQPDKAMDWLEKGFEQRDPKMPTIASIFTEFEPLFNNPRFIAICKKMNLPLTKN